MIKLSQKGWNNVIIFVTLGLILIFNFSSDFLNRNSEQTTDRSYLIPTHAVITTIQFPCEKIERIGQGWRATSGSMELSQITQLISDWQQAQIQLFSRDLPMQSSNTLIKIWFAGQTEPTNFEFLTLADKTLVEIEQQTYELVHPDLSLLLTEP